MNTIHFNGEGIVPSKVVCVGRNYVEHIYELHNELPTSMVLFMKPNSAITHTLTTQSQTTLHYEGEISFLIRNKTICGVGFGLDLTNRTLQSELKAKGLPWERAKAFNGAAVMSTFVGIEPSDLHKVAMQLWINDVLVQEGNSDLMIYKPLAILEEIESFCALEDNDIVMTGTPKGVGTFHSNDKFIGKIFIGSEEIVSQEWIVQ